MAQSNSYTPFGSPTQASVQAIPEDHSFIGERFDASTGLLYLNARYYDPALGRFLQPDWWEVRQAGVGINRYAYSFNDPVNLSDRNGNVAASVYPNSRRLAQQLAAEQLAGVRVPVGITGITGHGAAQILVRDGVGVNAREILRAFANPSRIRYVPSRFGPTFQFTGPNAVVVLNSQGTIVTAWSRGSLGIGGL